MWNKNLHTKVTIAFNRYKNLKLASCSCILEDDLAINLKKNTCFLNETKIFSANQVKRHVMVNVEKNKLQNVIQN